MYPALEAYAWMRLGDHASEIELVKHRAIPAIRRKFGEKEVVVQLSREGHEYVQGYLRVCYQKEEQCKSIQKEILKHVLANAGNSDSFSGAALPPLWILLC